MQIINKSFLLENENKTKYSYIHVNLLPKTKFNSDFSVNTMKN